MHKITRPLDPKTMKNEGFTPPNIWVITSKNEGFGFPWKSPCYSMFLRLWKRRLWPRRSPKQRHSPNPPMPLHLRRRRRFGAGLASHQPEKKALYFSGLGIVVVWCSLPLQKMVLLVVLICVGDLRKLMNIAYRGCVCFPCAGRFLQ